MFVILLQKGDYSQSVKILISKKMETSTAWSESVKKTFHNESDTVEHLLTDSKFKVLIEFDVNSVPKMERLSIYLQGLEEKDIEVFVQDAKNSNQQKVTIVATCECFKVCDAEGNCETICYICYPPPAAKCCCPGMCP